MPFLLPNQQHQSTEGISTESRDCSTRKINNLLTAAAGLLLWAWRVGDIDRLLQQLQANIGSATLSVLVGS